jgi:putative endopeptidase
MSRTRGFAVAAMLGAALIISGCRPAAESAVLPAERMGPWGFNTAGMDPDYGPGDDFFRHAVGDAFDALEIPGDRTSWGGFSILRRLSDERSRQIIESAANAWMPSGERAQIGKLYKSFMDEERLAEIGDAPLRADLETIRAADTPEEIAALMGASASTFHASFFSPFIYDDQKDPDNYTVYLNLASPWLPDRDYYLEDRFAEVRTAYVDNIEQTLEKIGWETPRASAEAVMAMETKFAEASWPSARRRDDVAMYNPMSPQELRAHAPEFPWDAYMEAAGLDELDIYVLGEVTAFPDIAEIFAGTDVPTFQAWQAYHTTMNAAPYLTADYYDLYFDFYGRTLSGVDEQRERWDRGVALVNGTLGEALGKVYADQYFPPESKAQMEQLVANLKVGMAERIEAADWMSEPTKAEAMRKLDAINVKIGYPDKWRDYSDLTVRSDDLYGNVKRALAFEWDYDLGRLDRPVDDTEWGMFPQTVNAYYNSTKNEIVFPAAILQPPFFDPEADMAVNYGAIGAVIGHEITHGFDDQGRKSDADGFLQDWWAPEDAQRFEERAAVLGAQYAQFEPVSGHFVNPELTMGENIADLGGLLMAYEAYHNALGGEEAPVIDGLTGDQRFFLGFSQIWLTKRREDSMIQLVSSDPHSPDIYRINGVVPNVDAFYEAFGIGPEDPMYIPPEQRARIW